MLAISYTEYVTDNGHINDLIQEADKDKDNILQLDELLVLLVVRTGPSYIRFMELGR